MQIQCKIYQWQTPHHENTISATDQSSCSANVACRVYGSIKWLILTVNVWCAYLRGKFSSLKTGLKQCNTHHNPTQNISFSQENPTARSSNWLTNIFKVHISRTQSRWNAPLLRTHHRLAVCVCRCSQSQLCFSQWQQAFLYYWQLLLPLALCRTLSLAADIQNTPNRSSATSK